MLTIKNISKFLQTYFQDIFPLLTDISDSRRFSPSLLVYSASQSQLNKRINFLITKKHKDTQTQPKSNNYSTLQLNTYTSSNYILVTYLTPLHSLNSSIISSFNFQKKLIIISQILKLVMITYPTGNISKNDFYVNEIGNIVIDPVFEIIEFIQEYLKEEITSKTIKKSDNFDVKNYLTLDMKNYFDNFYTQNNSFISQNVSNSLNILSDHSENKKVFETKVFNFIISPERLSFSSEFNQFNDKKEYSEEDNRDDIEVFGVLNLVNDNYKNSKTKKILINQDKALVFELACICLSILFDNIKIIDLKIIISLYRLSNSPSLLTVEEKESLNLFYNEKLTMVKSQILQNYKFIELRKTSGHQSILNVDHLSEPNEMNNSEESLNCPQNNYDKLYETLMASFSASPEMRPVLSTFDINLSTFTFNSPHASQYLLERTLEVNEMYTSLLHNVPLDFEKLLRFIIVTIKVANLWLGNIKMKLTKNFKFSVIGPGNDHFLHYSEKIEKNTFASLNNFINKEDILSSNYILEMSIKISEIYFRTLFLSLNCKTSRKLCMNFIYIVVQQCSQSTCLDLKVRFVKILLCLLGEITSTRSLPELINYFFLTLFKQILPNIYSSLDTNLITMIIGNLNEKIFFVQKEIDKGGKDEISKEKLFEREKLFLIYQTKFYCLIMNFISNSQINKKFNSFILEKINIFLNHQVLNKKVSESILEIIRNFLKIVDFLDPEDSSSGGVISNFAENIKNYFLENLRKTNSQLCLSIMMIVSEFGFLEENYFSDLILEIIEKRAVKGDGEWKKVYEKILVLVYKNKFRQIDKIRVSLKIRDFLAMESTEDCCEFYELEPEDFFLCVKPFVKNCL